jgi:LPS export ABC transporter protein LptC
MKRLAALACAFLAACNPKPPPNSRSLVAPSASPTALPLHVSGSGTATRPVRFVATEKKGNRKQFDLLAHSFVSNGQPGMTTITFHVVRVTFFAKDGTKLVAEAPRAVLDQTANDVRLEGGVTAHNSEGVKLNCDTLLYDRATEMLHGTGHVRIESPTGLSATGSKFESNVTLTDARMQ